VKIETTAGTLAAALSMAELALDDKSNIEALKMARVSAKDDRCELVVDALDRRVVASAPVTVLERGEAAARCVSLAGVLAGLRPDQAVRLVRDGDDVVVSAGRSRFRIPGLPLDNLPQSAELEAAAAEFSLDLEDMLHLIEATSYAASDEETRYYLNGIYLHITGTTPAPTLRAVASDGNRLAQADLPPPAGAEDMPGIIIPRKTITIVAKLLKRKGAPESVTLRVSDRLLELSLPDLKLTSKLIDGTFPDYQRIIPTSYDRSVTVERTELGAALARVEATLNPETRKLMRTVGLAWGDGALHVIRTSADVDDVLDAETNSAGKTALRISYVADALDVFSGKRISIASNGADTPIRFTDPADPTTFAIAMPIRSAP
jgi:DNA polymerase-3 subunit beta